MTRADSVISAAGVIIMMVSDIAIPRFTDLWLTAWAVPVGVSLAVLGVAQVPVVRLRFRGRLAATAIDAQPGPVGG